MNCILRFFRQKTKKQSLGERISSVEELKIMNPLNAKAKIACNVNNRSCHASAPAVLGLTQVSLERNSNVSQGNEMYRKIGE